MSPNYTSKDTALFWAKVDKTERNGLCWLWTGAKLKSGYGVKGWGTGNQLAHRISYEINIGKIPNGLIVCHKCDNPSCVNPSHLFLGTQQDNIDDKMKKGRYVYPDTRREKNGRHKLTNEQVAEIRERYKKGNINQQQLAAEFHVSDSTIGSIVNNHGWF